MHTIKDLTEILGYTTDQVRIRLDRLRPTLTKHIRRGENNKILVTDSGLSILQRAKELEKQNVLLKDIPNHLNGELSNTDKDSEPSLDQAGLIQEKEKRIRELQGRIEDLKERIDHLEQDKTYLRNKVDDFETKLLTGKTNRKGVIRKIWQRIW